MSNKYAKTVALNKQITEELKTTYTEVKNQMPEMWAVSPNWLAKEESEDMTNDDYTKMTKKELIDLVVLLNEDCNDAERAYLEYSALVRERDDEIRILKAKIVREQFAHEMTCEEAEKYRNELLNERLYSMASRNGNHFYINHKGDEIRVKDNYPPF